MIAQKYIAQVPATLGPINTGQGLGGYANVTNPGTTVASIISNVIGFLTIVAGLWFTINFILGAVSWISAGGDKGKVKEAKDKITQGVVGLAIVVAAYTIAGLLGRILGLNFLDIGGALKLILPGIGVGGGESGPKK